MKSEQSHIEREIYTGRDMLETTSFGADPMTMTVTRNLRDPELSRPCRLIIIAGLLEAGLTLTAEQLTRVFSISLRTAYRDMKEIRASGFPILCDKSRYSLNFLQWGSWIKSLSHVWIAGNFNKSQ